MLDHIVRSYDDRDLIVRLYDEIKIGKFCEIVLSRQ